MNYAKLSVRSLLLRWRQYISLFLVCAVGTGVSLFSFFLINGMLASLSMKAEIYYGGNYQFLGGRNSLEIYDCLELLFLQDLILRLLLLRFIMKALKSVSV